MSTWTSRAEAHHAVLHALPLDLANRLQRAGRTRKEQEQRVVRQRARHAPAPLLLQVQPLRLQRLKKLQ